MSIRKRNLGFITDASQSVVSGNGTNTVQAFKTYRVTVTAKDCRGVLIGHGGNNFVIEIYNQCTAGANFV